DPGSGCGTKARRQPGRVSDGAGDVDGSHMLRERRWPYDCIIYTTQLLVATLRFWQNEAKILNLFNGPWPMGEAECEHGSPRSGWWFFRKARLLRVRSRARRRLIRGGSELQDLALTAGQSPSRVIKGGSFLCASNLLRAISSGCAPAARGRPRCRAP